MNRRLQKIFARALSSFAGAIYFLLVVFESRTLQDSDKKVDSLSVGFSGVMSLIFLTFFCFCLYEFYKGVKQKRF